MCNGYAPRTSSSLPRKRTKRIPPLLKRSGLRFHAPETFALAVPTQNPVLVPKSNARSDDNERSIIALGLSEITVDMRICVGFGVPLLDQPASNEPARGISASFGALSKLSCFDSIRLIRDKETPL